MNPCDIIISESVRFHDFVLVMLSDSDRGQIHEKDDCKKHKSGSVLDRSRRFNIHAFCCHHIQVIGQRHEGRKHGIGKSRVEINSAREQNRRRFSGGAADADDNARDDARVCGWQNSAADCLPLRDAQRLGNFPVFFRDGKQRFLRCSDNDRHNQKAHCQRRREQ